MANKKRRPAVTKEIRLQWSNQAEWLVAFLERLSTNTSSHGSKWTIKMMEHYNKRFTRHTGKVPTGCTKMLNGYLSRVKQANKQVQHLIVDK